MKKMKYLKIYEKFILSVNIPVEFWLEIDKVFSKKLRENSEHPIWILPKYFAEMDENRFDYLSEVLANLSNNNSIPKGLTQRDSLYFLLKSGVKKKQNGILYKYEIPVKEIYIYNDEASEQEVIFKNEFEPKKKYIVEKGKIKK